MRRSPFTTAVVTSILAGGGVLLPATTVAGAPVHRALAPRASIPAPAPAPGARVWSLQSGKLVASTSAAFHFNDTAKTVVVAAGAGGMFSKGLMDPQYQALLLQEPKTDNLLVIDWSEDASGKTPPAAAKDILGDAQQAYGELSKTPMGTAASATRQSIWKDTTFMGSDLGAYLEWEVARIANNAGDKSGSWIGLDPANPTELAGSKLPTGTYTEAGLDKIFEDSAELKTPEVSDNPKALANNTYTLLDAPGMGCLTTHLCWGFIEDEPWGPVWMKDWVADADKAPITGGPNFYKAVYDQMDGVFNTKDPQGAAATTACAAYSAAPTSSSAKALCATDYSKALEAGSVEQEQWSGSFSGQSTCGTAGSWPASGTISLLLTLLPTGLVSGEVTANGSINWCGVGTIPASCTGVATGVLTTLFGFACSSQTTPLVLDDTSTNGIGGSTIQGSLIDNGAGSVKGSFTLVLGVRG